jgi:hypothetical protein
MSHTTTVRSWPAIGLGAFFATITGAVLFEDVLHGAPVTTAHAQTLAALVGAIAAAHMAWPALRSRQTLVQGAMLTILSIAALFYVCVSSGARNAETAGNKIAAISAANDVRAREEAQLAKAESMLAEAQAKMATECASGRGTRCRGVMATVDVYAAAIKGHMATLASLPAPKVNGYAHAAKVLRSWGIDVSDDWLGLNMPFIVVLISELGTVAFLHLGLGHKPAPKPIEPEFRDEDLMPLPAKEDNVVPFVRAFKAANGRKPTIPELQSKFPSMARTTLYRRSIAA